MNTTSPSMILGQRLRPHAEESAISDIQQVVNRLVAVLRYRRWLFILPTLAGMIAALFFCLHQPREYALRGVFERRLDPVITNLVTSQSPYSFETLRRSLVLNMLGYEAIDRVVEDLGLTKAFPREADGALTRQGQARKQALIRDLQPQLQVVLLEQSSKQDLIEVRYKGNDAALGVKMVRQLTDNYIAQTRSRITRIIQDTQSFFSREAERRKQQANQKELELIAMSSQHPGVNPATPDLLDQRLLTAKQAGEQSESQLAEVESDIAARQSYLSNLAEQEAHGGANRTTQPSLYSTQLLPNPQRAKLGNEIDQVQANITHAKTVNQMTDAHPYVVGLRQKLNQLRAEFEQLPEAISGELANSGSAIAANSYEAQRQRIGTELAALQKKRDPLAKDLDRRRSEQAYLEKEKESLSERRQAFMVGQQELGNLKSDLTVWERNLASINQLLTAESEDRGIKFAIVEQARAPRKPNSPTLAGVLMVAGGVGLALGAALVFLREIFDRSLRYPARVRELLGVPVLESIGEIVVGQPRTQQRRGTVLITVAAVQGLGVLAMGALNYLSIEQPGLYQRLMAGLPGALPG